MSCGIRRLMSIGVVLALALLAPVAVFGDSSSRAAAADVNVAINFEPVGAPVPVGWTADTGAAYSAASGQGWVRQDSIAGAHTPLDVSANARDRNLVSDQTQDTFIHMQYPPLNAPAGAVTTPAAWELAVANGDYTVVVSVGDAGAFFDSTNRINIEGTVAIAGFVPTSTNRFATATRTVTVSDGRLTIDATGGTNTKIDYVRVSTATDTTPPAAPGGVTATGGNAIVTLAWNANSEPDLRGYDVYRGTSTPVSTTGTPLNGTTPLTTTTLTDTTVTNGTTYNYVVVASDTNGNPSQPSSTVTATPTGPTPPPPAGLVLIADSTLSAPAASFDITNIPPTYKHLQIVASLRTTKAAIFDPVRIRFNNDSGPNYQNVIQYTVDGINATTEENSATGGYTEAMAANSPSGSFAAITVWIPDYASTVTTYKNFTSTSGGLKDATSPHLVDAGGSWKGGGAAISRITLVPGTGPNFLAGSRVTVYGLN